MARLSKFIDHSVGLKSSLLEHATDNFLTHVVSLVYHHENHTAPDRILVLTTIRCKGIDLQVSHMTQVLSQLSPTLSIVNYLKLHAEPNDPPFEDDVELPHLLHRFSAVKTLHESQKLAGQVALVL